MRISDESLGMYENILSIVLYKYVNAFPFIWSISEAFCLLSKSHCSCFKMKTQKN